MRIPRMAFVAFALALTSVSVQAQTGFWSCPRGFQGQTLSVYNWTTYIAEDTISNFERLCGVDVTYNTYATDTDMVDELRAGGTTYDIVVPSNSSVYVMIEEGLIQPINLSHIPNFANVGARFANPPYDPGNQYTVPYQWGTVAIGYNRARIGRDISSWNDVFQYSGNVAWIDEYRAMLGFALVMLGKDPNTSDPELIGQAAQYLITNSANVASIAPDTGQDLLESGEVDIAIEYSGDIYQLIASCGCNDFRYVIPSEGAQAWSDSLAIPTGAKNMALAEVFMDYVLNAQTGADISNYTAYASPNAQAISDGLINFDYLDDPAIYPDDALIAKLFFNVSSAAVDEQYANAWTVVTTAIQK